MEVLLLGFFALRKAIRSSSVENNSAMLQRPSLKSPPQIFYSEKNPFLSTQLFHVLQFSSSFIEK